MILGSAAIHAYWGVLLLFGSEVLKATAVAGLYLRVPHQGLLACLLCLAAAMAAQALVFRPGLLSLAFLAPQQVALFDSAWSIIAACIHGRYADGTVVPGGWQHISGDQAPMLVWAVGHVVGVILLHRPGPRE